MSIVASNQWEGSIAARQPIIGQYHLGEAGGQGEVLRLELLGAGAGLGDLLLLGQPGHTRVNISTFLRSLLIYAHDTAHKKS